MRLSRSLSRYLVLGGGIAAAALLSAAAPAYAWEEIHWDGQIIQGDPWTNPTTISQANGTTGPKGTVLTWTSSQPGVWDTIYFGGPTSSLWSSVTLSLDSVKLGAGGTQDWTFDYSILNASQTKNSLVTDFTFTEASKLSLPSRPSNDITGDWNAIAFENDCKKTATSTVACDFTHKTYVDSTVTLSDTRGTGGVNQGDTAQGTFTVILASAVNSFSLSDPSVEYEYSSQSGQQYGPLFSVSNCGPDGKTGPGYPVGWIPEPGTWGLMLAGFFGMGAILRRRQQAIPPLAAA